MYTETTASDGLEWSLIFAYYHIGGQNNALVPGVFPTSSTQGYSHMVLDSIGVNASEIDAVRFYCHKSMHSRKIHFKTSTAGAILTVVTNTAHGCDSWHCPSSASDWNSGFTPYPDHNAYLPAATGSSATLDNAPFFKTSQYHFYTYPPQRRWECDDYANNEYYTTLHQAWVHFK